MVRLLPDRNCRLVRQRLGQKRSQNLDHRLATLARDRISIRGPFEQVRLSAWLQAHDRLLWRGTNPRGWSLEAHRDDCADRVSESLGKGRTAHIAASGRIIHAGVSVSVSSVRRIVRCSTPPYTTRRPLDATVLPASG